MMKMISFIIGLLLVGFSAFSQQKAVFRSFNYAGIVAGESSPAFEFHTVNGIAFKQWTAGVGLGWDRYRIESFPLYLSLKREWGGRRHAFMAGIDGGGNFSEFRPGVYGRTGVGWKVKLQKLRSAFLMDVGYSYKQLIEKRWVTMPCLVPPCMEVGERYNYQFTSLSFRMGWMF